MVTAANVQYLADVIDRQADSWEDFEDYIYHVTDPYWGIRAL